MKNDFEKIQEIILSIDKLTQVEICEILIKNFHKHYEAKGHDFAHNLLGFLEAAKLLKFKN